ncbi:MAG: CocE/NonD family hydrolase, partial [Planctomycetes bacterium]|nr:CocE/NonD family hydrolase [Planctomycetota bacterium]
WRSAWEWPLPDEKPTRFYLHARAIDRQDGLLSQKPPKANPGRIEYTVDYSTTSGTSNRWRNAHGGPGAYSDMNPNDLKGLHFTSAPLTHDVEITGHPVAKLWINTNAEDGDFFVYLEEVDSEGYSHYITEGSLRVTHRSLSEPDYDYLGLPYHRSYKADMTPLTGEPMLLEIDLLPTSNIFDKGNRIRVTITCADRDNLETPVVDPPPIVTLECNPELASSIVLPIIEHRK